MTNVPAPAWEQVKALLDEALERPEAERAAFVARRAAGDGALRAEVESLLAAWDRAESSGAITAAFDLPAPSGGEQDTARIGQVVGSWRLEALVGHGGMGVVYRGEHTDARLGQRAAVKLLRRDYRPEDLRRFRDEQRILARLEHPHIARMLDAGITEDGTPYLAMEYVEGEPLLEHCRSHRLDLHARLELFEAICMAVQAAHRSLIVHRDLKPSNLFVDASGAPRLLDFGIAKRLGDTGEVEDATRTGQHVLTPEYASPEQFRAEPPSTLSDVYSLGVVLHELLTGERPHRLAGLTAGQAERIVCTEEPRKPSSYAGPFARSLAGDLDLVVLTALAKEPSRRYASAADLADELRRFRAGLPIQARPDTIGYRARKFAGRNRGVLATLALVLLALVAGVVSTARQAQQTKRRFEQVRALANTLLFDIQSEIRDQPGMTPLRERIVNRATAHLAGLAEDAKRDPALRGELAAAYEQLGELQGDPSFASLGDLPGAIASYRQARVLRQQALADAPGDPVRLHALARVTARLATALSWGGDNAAAVTLASGALDTLTLLRRGQPADSALVVDEACVRIERGWFRIWASDLEPGTADVRAGIAVLDSMRARHSGNLDLALARAEATIDLTDGLKFANRYTDMAREIEPVIAELDTLALTHPAHVRLRRRQLGLMRQLGEAYEVFAPGKAEAIYRRAVAVAEQQYVVDASNFSTRRNLASCWNHLGGVLLDGGRPAEAIPALRRASAEQRWLFERDASNHSDGSNLSTSLMWESQCLTRLGRHEEAISRSLEALAVRESLLTRSAGDAANIGNLGSAAGAVGLAYLAEARDSRTPPARRPECWRAARTYFVRGAEVFERLKGGGALMDFWQQDHVRCLQGMAACDSALGTSRTRR
ncbi:MAG: serine/threonine protein kinase [Candidatus Eisenbacteria bacterium]|uniref:Serine/threonine protein kinase n=1 Tax=Eiseniibacteriota bacterium TaxID=2212470 RepID=A0A933SDH7_UNCEI|nr:serine/threonine protein kinase [Candidatus Eisenbacteria bacterium]